MVFPDKVFQEIYSGYQNMVGIVQADAIKELTKEAYAQVEKAVQDLSLIHIYNSAWNKERIWPVYLLLRMMKY